MLDRLLETGPRQKKSAWGGMTSVIVHGSIIALAVYSTAEATPRTRFVGDGPVIPVFSPPPTEQTNAHHTGSSGGATRPGTGVPRIPDPGASIDVNVPTPDITTTAAGSGDALAEIGAGGPPGSAVTLGGPGGPTSEATLDLPVRVLTERTPTYPEMLRAAGITGAVRVQFIVDTSGRAEPASIRILDSTHDLFTRAVLTALRQSRFTAGEVSGHRVRTLVERSYRFDFGSAQ